MFLQMVKSAIVCLCPGFLCLLTLQEEMSFLNKVGFKIFVEVIGFIYVFEDG